MKAIKKSNVFHLTVTIQELDKLIFFNLLAASVQSVLESSSSNSSVTQEPTVCAQLLSSYHYQHLGKGDAVFACQVTY